jgi:hypothetical protein
MSPGHIPKDLLYGKLASGKRKTENQKNMIEAKISLEDWERQADDRSAWRAAVWEGVKLWTEGSKRWKLTELAGIHQICLLRLWQRLYGQHRTPQP